MSFKAMPKAQRPHRRAVPGWSKSTGILDAKMHRGLKKEALLRCLRLFAVASALKKT